MPDTNAESGDKPASQPIHVGGHHVGKAVGGRGLTALYPDLDIPPDPRLIAEGWERRFTADPRGTKEAIQLYTEMGYEVHTEPVKPTELSDDCQGCALATRFFMTIYTRKR